MHGIEPQLLGGRVEVVVERRDDSIIIRVSDDGRGLNVEKRATGMTNGISHGVGMDNSRNRLRAVFGPQAGMQITENKPSGVVVELDLGELELDKVELGEI